MRRLLRSPLTALILGLVYFSLAPVADAAIAYDNAATKDLGTAQNPTTSYTVGTGDNRVLVVFFYDNLSATEHLTGITYNGVAMTKVGNFSNTTVALNVSAYYLNNPASGANTLAFSTSASNNYYAAVASYSGAQYDSGVVTGKLGSKDTSFAQSITTSVTGAWGVSMVAGGGGTPVASTNINSTRASGFSFMAVGDSNASLGAAGGYTLAWTPGNGNDWYYGAAGISLKPAAAAGGGFQLWPLSLF